MASIEVVTINGYTAFEEVSISIAFNAGAQSFSAKLAAELGASATNRIFDVGTPVTITANGELLLTGYVDAKEPHIAAREAFITISGRSKSSDLVDSSGKHKTGYFENKDPLEIGKAISEGI